MRRFAFDAQSPIGIEAVLTRPQFLPVEGRPHLAFGERAVEGPEGRLLERAGLHASRNVADEFDIDIRARTPASPQTALEKVQERVRMALSPIRVLRHIPGMVEFGGRGGRVRLGAREVKLEQASVRAFPNARIDAEGRGIEESVGTIAEPLADLRVVRRRKRRGEAAEKAPPGVEARPERPPASLRKPDVEAHGTPIVSATREGNRSR